MKRMFSHPSLLTATALVVGMALGAGIAFAAHPQVPLKTYEEIGLQLSQGQSNIGPAVQLDANAKGFPYSPKQSCSSAGNPTGNCHDYNAIADHAFHGELGMAEWKDSSDGTFAKTVQTRQKPWTQSAAMWGKW